MKRYREDDGAYTVIEKAGRYVPLSSAASPRGASVAFAHSRGCGDEGAVGGGSECWFHGLDEGCADHGFCLLLLVIRKGLLCSSCGV